jgi:hypothetical protein
MREEDRALLGGDFAGDIDAQAPVVVLKRADGSPVTALVQFNGHPVTMYHPEKLVASGDWPQVACRILAKKLRGIPVSFLQGCAGDVNSKHMFSADVQLANRYGSWLGATYVAVLRDLRRSAQAGYEFATPRVAVPLGGVPAAATLKREIAETYGESEPRRVMHLAQEQLALMLSLSRQTTNQILKELQAQGVVQLTYGEIEILDFERLRQLAS